MTDDDKALVERLVESLCDAAKLIDQARADAKKLEAENERLRAALTKWDRLIEHQYSGSREAMSAMHEAAQFGLSALGATDYGDMTKEDYEAIYGWGGQG